MLMLYSGRRRGMLLPSAWDTEWTDLTQVFSDQIPEPAGTGATQIVQQSMGLDRAQSAAYVNRYGGGGYAGLVRTPPQRMQPVPVTPMQPRNPRWTRVGIQTGVNTNTPLLGGDDNRTLVLIQNNEASGGGTLLISVDGPINTATPAFYLNLPPVSQGILIDRETLTNPIYVAWTGTPAAGGVLFYASRTPPPLPYINPTPESYNLIAANAAAAALDYGGFGYD
jgi:hypothetical protein